MYFASAGFAVSNIYIFFFYYYLKLCIFQLYNLWRTLDFSDPKILADFNERLENSTVMHTCSGAEFSVSI